jgi:peptide/nickel transport system ATP-binding protein
MPCKILSRSGCVSDDGRPWRGGAGALSLLEVAELKTEIRLRAKTVRAVDGVSFSVSPGETLGLVGESGCGKTMTGMSIMRLLPAGGEIAGGRIDFDGRDLATTDLKTMQSVRGNQIGMVFQDPMTSLNPTMTIGKQIASPVRLHRKVSKHEAMERAAAMLALVGVPRPDERLSDYPHQLSGGLRQRAIIAMALACQPKLLIADEPTTALDVTVQAQILSLLDDLKDRFGMGMILITHDMGVIAGHTDRVMVMYAGRIVETARTEALFNHMRHPYTEALLASIPHLDQDKSQRLYSIPGLPPDLTSDLTGCRFAPRCAYATGICWETEPRLADARLADDAGLTHDGRADGHQFACHHPINISVGALAVAAHAMPAPVLGAGATAIAAEGAATGGAGPAGLVNSGAGHHGGLQRTDAPVPDGHVDAIAGGETILEFVSVSKEFPVTTKGFLQRRLGVNHAVTDVSLSVRRGGTFGLVGESGCGKTTLGRLAVALETPTSGQVRFEGTDIFALPRDRLRTVRRGLQIMFQDPYASLDPRMQVGEIVAEPLAVRGDPPLQRAALVNRLLGEVGLSQSAMSRYPHEFSGGQRQRIGLARALALNPPLIVADEPVSALDVSIRSQILNLMKELQTSHGLTYVVISHDLSVVRYIADHIAVMYLGKLVEMGPADDVYSRPVHPYTRGLLDAIPVPDPQAEKSKKTVPMRGEMPSAMNPPSGCRFRTRCPRAQARCAEEVPALVSFGGEHRAACHFPLEDPAGVE